MRSSVLLSSGRYFDFHDLDNAKFGIKEVAHALSNLCRFGGHCAQFYSVAQHSVFVSRVVAPAFALEGLLHDAAEAFLGDVPTPLKQLLPDYQQLENQVEAKIQEIFQVNDWRYNPLIKHADLIALATERRDLMPPTDDSWAILEGITASPLRLVPMHPKEAYGAFLARYSELRER